jgi:hypothetical protein
MEDKMYFKDINNRRTLTLRTAEKLINQERRAEYGDPKENFDRIAKMWSAYLGFEICGADVAVMMVLLKVSRIKGSPEKQDTYDDMTGYSALAAELAIGDLNDQEKNTL